MIQPIVPAVLEARRAPGEDLLQKSILVNAKRIATRLGVQSALIQDALRAGKLKIVPARYSLADGDVEFFE